MPLLLDLLRHGEAAPAGPDGDRGRKLTPAGEAALRSLGLRLAASGVPPDRAFASPRRRADESARIVLAIWKPELEIETLTELEPDTDPGDLLRALSDLSPLSTHLLVVGHLPLLDRVCVRLTGSPAGFGPATLHRIECDKRLRKGGGRRIWTLEPGA